MKECSLFHNTFFKIVDLIIVKMNSIFGAHNHRTNIGLYLQTMDGKLQGI